MELDSMIPIMTLQVMYVNSLWTCLRSGIAKFITYNVVTSSYASGLLGPVHISMNKSFMIILIDILVLIPLLPLLSLTSMSIISSNLIMFKNFFRISLSYITSIRSILRLQIFPLRSKFTLINIYFVWNHIIRIIQILLPLNLLTMKSRLLWWVFFFNKKHILFNSVF